MKNLLLTLTLLICASTVTASDVKPIKLFMTDYKCMGDCMAKGYVYGYCQRICSY